MFSRDRLVGITGLIIGLLYLAGTLTLQQTEIGDPLGPAGYPMLLGVAMCALSISVIMARRPSPAEQPDLDNAPEATSGGSLGLRLLMAERRHRAVLLSLGWIAFYALTFEWLGYLLSTSATALGLLRLARRGSLLADVAIAVGFALFTQTLFSYFIVAGFPNGLLEPLLKR